MLKLQLKLKKQKVENEELSTKYLNLVNHKMS